MGQNQSKQNCRFDNNFIFVFLLSSVHILNPLRTFCLALFCLFISSVHFLNKPSTWHRRSPCNWAACACPSRDSTYSYNFHSYMSGPSGACRASTSPETRPQSVSAGRSGSAARRLGSVRGARPPGACRRAWGRGRQGRPRWPSCGSTVAGGRNERGQGMPVVYPSMDTR